VFLCFDDANIERFLICPKLFLLIFCISLDFQMNKFSYHLRYNADDSLPAVKPLKNAI